MLSIYSTTKHSQRILFTCIFITCMAGLSGCSIQSLIVRKSHHLEPSCEYHLLSPASYGSELWKSYRLTFIASGQQTTMRTILEINAQRLSLVALNALGSRGLLVTLTSQNFESEHSRTLPLPVTPEKLLATLQFALWPDAAIKETYQKCNLNYESLEAPFRQHLARSDGVIILHVAQFQDQHKSALWGGFDQETKTLLYINEE